MPFLSRVLDSLFYCGYLGSCVPGCVAYYGTVAIFMITAFIKIDRYCPRGGCETEVGAFLSWDTFEPIGRTGLGGSVTSS